MTGTGRVGSRQRGAFDVARWESYFTTRDGALSDITALRNSLSWRVTRPLRRATTVARAGAIVLRGGTAASEHPRGTAAFALDERLRTVAPAILGATEAATLASASVGLVLERLCERVRRSDRRYSWLLFTAMSGVMPTENALATFMRTISVGIDATVMSDLLDLCGRTALEHASQLRRLRLVSDRPVVLVDFIARHGFNSGVQRVAREVSTRWNQRGVELVAMTVDGGAFRELDTDETERVLAWTSELYKDTGNHRDEPDQVVLIPWDTTVTMLEVPNRGQTPTLAAFAHYSGNRVVAVGYDTIPTSSATFVGPHESINFASYLAMIKYVDVVVAISETTAEEFRGFGDALAAQGLGGPRVRAQLLPVRGLKRDTTADESSAQDEAPVVLAVGSHEPRKNHIALVFAAERLWREGHRFSLLLLGGRGPLDYTDVHDAVAALTHAGRPIEVRNDVTDEALAEAYARARFTVFLSLHEGFGLPVAESLGAGTPALVTRYGSVAEIAEGGGCVTVDPRDDEAVVAALRELITDDALVERLRDEIVRREDSDWDDYAEALWAQAFTTEDAR